MAFELKVDANYVVVTDTATSEIRGSFPINHCAYRETDDTFVILENIDTEVETILKRDIALGLWVDASAVAFTESTLRQWLRVNTGFKSAGGGSSAGIWGITDSTGAYTYYADIASANASASAGDTIELFANVRETNAVEWVLKPNVTYQLNGYTYTLDEPTGTNVLNSSSITGTDEVHIMNGIIKRTGGGAGGNFDNMILYSLSAGLFYFHDTIFENDDNTIMRISNGIYDGGVYRSLNNGSASTTTGAIFINSGQVNNAKIYTKSYMGIRSFGGTFVNCFVYSQNTRAIQLSSAGSLAINCTGYSDGGNGIAVQNASAKALNCTAISTSTTALELSGIAENCYAYSSAGHAVHALSANSRIKGSIMRSRLSLGLLMSIAGGVAEDCTIISEASQAVSMTGTMLNCSVEGANLTYGDCVTANNDSRIFGCSLRVTNASAECLASSSAVNVYYGNNIFAGNPTLAVNANITQAQTANHDNRGNIEID